MNDTESDAAACAGSTEMEIGADSLYVAVRWGSRRGKMALERSDPEDRQLTWVRLDGEVEPRLLPIADLELADVGQNHALSSAANDA